MNRTRCVASLVLGMTFLGVLTLSANCFGQSKNDELRRLPVKNLQLQGENIGLILSRFSVQNNIPIGLEVSLDDDLSITKTIAIDIKDGTVEEVLNSIVHQNPLYSWEVRDKVVNVFPRESSRDLVLKEVLETKLDKITVDKETRRFNLRESLCKNPAVMNVLNVHHVIPANESFGSRDFGRLGRDFSFAASNISLATVLNHVIRESQTKYWVILRYGERRQYLVLNL
jgi:hypothetical protein